MDRQLYPDFLRAISISRIVIFHFIGWQFLTYFPSLGIMFALAGWFIAISLQERPAVTVLYQRLCRLMPAWWGFGLIVFLSGFFYAKGAGISLETTFAWLFPYQQVTWNLDNAYANDAVVITWYIAAYLWLMLLSPILLYVYRKLSWIAVYAPVVIALIYSHFFPEQDTIFGETLFNVLIFSGCWMLGFTKADGEIEKLPKYIIYLTALAFSLCGVLLTYQEGSLGGNPTALAIMSFGIAMLLLHFNPDLSFLPTFSKTVIRTMNTFAVTIYLFHNSLIDVANYAGGYLEAYDIGNRIGLEAYNGAIGDWICFSITLLFIYIAVKTIGIIETHRWFPKWEKSR